MVWIGGIIESNISRNLTTLSINQLAQNT
jgi:hypothetical protein